MTCEQLYIPSQTKKHNSTKDHRLIAPITDDQLARPSTWLPTLENDAKEAQYMFTKKSVSLILGTIMRNNIRWVHIFETYNQLQILYFIEAGQKHSWVVCVNLKVVK